MRVLTSNPQQVSRNKKMTDILLIQPPIRDFYLTTKRTIPYGLACLASTLIQDGFSVRIVDGLASTKSRILDLPEEMAYLNEFYGKADRSPFALFSHYKHFGYSFDHIAKTAKASQAFLVGVSCLFTPYMQEAVKTAETVKALHPSCKIVMGGHHPTADPQGVMQSPAVDFVLRGEGEVSVSLLAKAIKIGGPYDNIPGLVYRKSNGDLRINSPAPISGTNASGGANGGGIEVARNVSANLQNNTVSGNVAHRDAGPSDSAAGGGMDVNCSTVAMSQNRFLGNRSSQGGWGTPAVWVWEGSLTSINDVFARNAGGVGAGAGGYDRSFSDVTIINDTFYDNGRVGVEANMTSTVYVTNTIVYGHDQGLSLNDPASTLIGGYNLLSNTTNYAGGVVSGTHDIIGEDPLFLDAPNDDFHIASDSPAVDAGTSVGAPLVDFDDEPRPQGVYVDIGADEAAGQDIYLPIIMKNY